MAKNLPRNLIVFILNSQNVYNKFTCSGSSDFALLAIGVNKAIINFATSRDVSPSFHNPNSVDPKIVAPNNAPRIV